MTMKIRKTNLKIRQAYFDWLYNQIKEEESLRFKNFIFEFHSIPFICIIPNDDNRAEDGCQLRYRFADLNNNSDPPLSGACTILEMLIALANRMDFILFDEAKGERCPKWFWLFIDNLKLQKYDNDESAESKKKFNKIVLRKFVKREYQGDGRGGLFPLNSPANDQRHVEIWYQMMDYISENYDI